MTKRNTFLNLVVAACVALLVADAAQAEQTRAQELLEQLSRPELPNWQQVENALRREWSKSGSAAMDLLLKRGRDAMEAEQFEAALEHLTALVDHAPDFAEAYNARATAYFNLGLHGPAIHDLGQALALNPNHFGALTGLGMLMEESNRQAKALQAYSAAAAIHPHDPDLQRALQRLEKQVSGVDL